MWLQNVSLDDIVPQRILFGFFPTYRKSPLRPQWDRIMQVLVALVEDPSPRSDVNSLSFCHIDKLDSWKVALDVPFSVIALQLLGRRLQVGDASGIQSPLSFGGFGALTRHLARLTSAITGAVQVQGSRGRPQIASTHTVCWHGHQQQRHLPPQQHVPWAPIAKPSILSSPQADALDSQALAAINAYNPGLSGAWMLQRAMSLRVGQKQVAVSDGCSSA